MRPETFEKLRIEFEAQHQKTLDQIEKIPNSVLREKMRRSAFGDTMRELRRLKTCSKPKKRC